ncbi:hypothetical protein CL684_00870 [Candidatus Campbellbacteria bacterium]|nr:hypothetical protein [Candidatus Campbellbacteria bacterium]|tara:strand:+ start:438 stop:797 length:360 start_codon:yes stop_codon:yes gene_type:complete
MKKFFTQKKTAVIGISTWFFAARKVYAQIDSSNVTTVASSATKFINDLVIPILVSLALFFTIVSITRYILESDSQTKEGRKQQIISGLLGLFIILSLWGIIQVIGRTFNLFAGGDLSVG